MDDQAPTLLPHDWIEAIARGEADLTAGRVIEIDTEALCREIADEAAMVERKIVAGRVSPV
jgi:hypothetical protein